jgi:hypothetical protein
MILDGLVKSPSAALRFNFGSFCETIVLVTFHEIITLETPLFSGSAVSD